MLKISLGHNLLKYPSPMFVKKAILFLLQHHLVRHSNKTRFQNIYSFGHNLLKYPSPMFESKASSITKSDTPTRLGFKTLGFLFQRLNYRKMFYNIRAMEQHIFAFSLIIEGTTEKVLQF
jgi:hypothetical protein